MSRPQMSIMTLYLITIATHLLKFFSSHYRVNEEQFRLKIDLKNKNKQTKTENLFCGSTGRRGGLPTAISIANPFSMLELKDRDRGGGGAGRAAAPPLFCAPAPTFCAKGKIIKLKKKKT